MLALRNEGFSNFFRPHSSSPGHRVRAHGPARHSLCVGGARPRDGGAISEIAREGLNELDYLRTGHGIFRADIHRQATAKFRNYTLAEPAIKGCGTLYDGVGSVKRHLDCASFAGSFFVFPSKKIFSLSRMPTKARS
jgi:hypothetical protein